MYSATSTSTIICSARMPPKGSHNVHILPPENSPQNELPGGKIYFISLKSRKKNSRRLLLDDQFLGQ